MTYRQLLEAYSKACELEALIEVAQQDERRVTGNDEEKAAAEAELAAAIAKLDEEIPQ